MKFTTIALVSIALLQCAVLSEGEETGFSFINGRVLLPPRVFKKGGGVRLVVNGEHATYVRANGTFMLNLPPGTHLIDFAVREFMMPQLRIDVSKKSPGKYRAMFNDKSRVQLQEPLEVEQLAQVSYFDQHEEISLSSKLMNPMVLMMVFFGGMAFLMPMLVDPEEMKQMRKENPGGLMEMIRSAANEGQQTGQPQVTAQQPKRVTRPKK
eukprot:TRINITY_DN765_c8_g1_i1.p1 TRINITY_DN765_c8_g1~~TRINITY_DN765_c8_g1_i1.p1  ORF type:complete len:224 (+),score=61.91 TRINITY_DN765_c8_g1_i1:43-672(+)